MIQAAMLTWVPLCIYSAAVIPQIIKNVRLRSASGVSQAMIGLRIAAVSFYAVYLFSCGLTIAYRVMMPIYFMLLSSIAVQGYLYDADARTRQLMRRRYAALLVVIGIAVLNAYRNPWQGGMLSGWIAIVLYTICEIPQVYKNYMRKSVQGFSFLFASMLAVGAAIEGTLTLWLGLPKPTLASSIRILTFYSMYCIQFVCYRVVAEQK